MSTPKATLASLFSKKKKTSNPQSAMNDLIKSFENDFESAFFHFELSGIQVTIDGARRIHAICSVNQSVMLDVNDVNSAIEAALVCMERRRAIEQLKLRENILEQCKIDISASASEIGKAALLLQTPAPDYMSNLQKVA